MSAFQKMKSRSSQRVISYSYDQRQLGRLTQNSGVHRLHGLVLTGTTTQQLTAQRKKIVVTESSQNKDKTSSTSCLCCYFNNGARLPSFHPQLCPENRDKSLGYSFSFIPLFLYKWTGVFLANVLLWYLKCLGFFHVSQLLALCTVHQDSQFKARSMHSSVSNKTYFAGSILMLGTRRALITVKYWGFSKCVGSFLKFLILVPAGVTETKHIMRNMRSLGTTGQAFPTSRRYCKRKKLLLYHFFTTLFDFSILPAKLDD